MLRKNLIQRRLGLSKLLWTILIISTGVAFSDNRVQLGFQVGQFRLFDRGVAEFLAEAEGVNEVAQGIFLSFDNDVDFFVFDRLSIEIGYQRKTLFDSDIPSPFTDRFTVYRLSLKPYSVFPVNKSLDLALAPVLGYGAYRTTQESQSSLDLDDVYINFIVGLEGSAEVKLSARLSVVTKVAYEYFQNDIGAPEPVQNGRIGSFGSIIDNFNGFRIGFGVIYSL